MDRSAKTRRYFAQYAYVGAIVYGDYSIVEIENHLSTCSIGMSGKSNMGQNTMIDIDNKKKRNVLNIVCAVWGVE